MIVWLLKFVHLAGIALWAGGLMTVPFLMRQKDGLAGDDLVRLHRMVRLLYVAILSPAAFVSIGTGTALIFLRATHGEWFTLKLLFVGVLAALHVRLGLLVLSVFEDGGRLSRWGARLLTLGVVSSAGAVLVVVLWKPRLPMERLAPGLFQPGALAEFLQPLIAWVTP